ncbi:sigma-54-dependent transcriptional regulator [Pyxidicoccus sp. 3LFB2]
MARILVIDDHDTLREGMAVTLTRSGHTVAAVRSGADGLASYRKAPFDLVVTDLKMDGMDGIEVTKALKTLDPAAVVMVVTAFGTIETAVRAMQEGAYDFITKPFPPEVLRAKVDKGLELATTRRQVEKLTARTAAHDADAALTHGSLVGDSEPMHRLVAQVRKVAASEATVLVRGESGTGKELVARMVHQMSPRAAGPFVVVHCAALAETLLESELFGHERGAFTGAVRDSPGHFRLANRGSLFLDEVAEMPLDLQAKMLRVLETRTVIPVGGREPVPVDVRIIAATHRALRREVEAGRFRADLMYRLRVVPLFLPSLRERPGDILPLAMRFLDELQQRGSRRVERFSPGARRLLEGHAWPGNVRELRNVMEYTYVIGEGPVVREADLPPEFSEPRHTAPAPPAVSLEPEQLRAALAQAGGNRSEAARLLGISRVTLWRRLRDIGGSGNG